MTVNGLVGCGDGSGRSVMAAAALLWQWWLCYGSIGPVALLWQWWLCFGSGCSVMAVVAL
jgi:hypothetical protein